MDNLNPDKNQELKQIPKIEFPEQSKELEVLPQSEKQLTSSAGSEIQKPGKQISTQTSPVDQLIEKNPEVTAIENILASDLFDIYQNMPQEKKHEFKQKGESAAANIATLLVNMTVKVKEILRIITDWLKIIPGVNKFFLEQEAKIKTDQIIQKYQNKKFE